MDDFFKSMKDNLEQRPEPPFRLAAWQNLEQKLESYKDESPRGFAFWIAALGIMLLGSLLFNGWMYSRWQRQGEGGGSQQEVRVDTVLVKQVVYKTDTIYQNRLIEQRVYQKIAPPIVYFDGLPSSRIAHLQERFTQIEDPSGTSPTWPANWSDNYPIFSATSFRQVQKSVVDEHKLPGLLATTIEQIPLARPLLQAPQISLTNTDMAIEDEKKGRKNVSQFLLMMQPNGLQFGVQAGVLVPNSSISKGVGFQTGLEAQLLFPYDWQVWMRASYKNAHYQTNNWSQYLGIPEPVPPSDQHSLKELNYFLPTLQYSLGIQRLFNARKVWHPLAGIGFGGTKQLSTEVKYEFLDAFNQREAETDQLLEPTKWWHGQLMLRTGLCFDLRKQWKWQVLGEYHIQNNSRQQLYPSTFSGLVTISYRFK